MLRRILRVREAGTFGVFYLYWGEEFAGALVDQSLTLDWVGNLFQDLEIFEVSFVAGLTRFLKLYHLEIFELNRRVELQ